MSRTDGHAPYWTWATWYEPVHHPHCENYISRGWQKVAKRPCDLPKRPVRHGGGRTRAYVPLCAWEPVWPERYRDTLRLFGEAVPPRWFIRHVWFGPERARERDQLKKMAKEHNACGEILDGDFPNWQARHCAIRWWD